MTNRSETQMPRSSIASPKTRQLSRCAGSKETDDLSPRPVPSADAQAAAWSHLQRISVIRACAWPFWHRPAGIRCRVRRCGSRHRGSRRSHNRAIVLNQEVCLMTPAQCSAYKSAHPRSVGSGRRSWSCRGSASTTQAALGAEMMSTTAGARKAITPGTLRCSSMPNSTSFRTALLTA